MNLASSDLFPPIPADTDNAARFVFTSGNFYLAIGNHINQLFFGLFLGNPFGWAQNPEQTLGMLYMITIFQYVETLPDWEAAEALRRRVDWKYALHLPLDFRGMNASAFCEFRKWLLVDQENQKNLQALLVRLSEITMLPRKRALSLQTGMIIRSVCLQNRLAIAWRAISDVLGVLAIKNPEWLLTVTLPNWYVRYGQNGQALNSAAKKVEQEDLAQEIGLDGVYLLKAITDANLPLLEDLPEVAVLKHVWHDQFRIMGEKILWRKESCSGCASTTQPKASVAAADQNQIGGQIELIPTRLPEKSDDHRTDYSYEGDVS